LRVPGERWQSGPVTALEELALFAGVMVLGQFSPGPDMILLTRTALRDGVGAGLRMAAGIATGLTVHATLALSGLAVAFGNLPSLRLALQWMAAAYLLWIAWRMAAEHFVAMYSGSKPAAPPADSTRSPYLRGLFCNLFNPKVALFLAAVCAPFLAGGHPAWWPFAMWALIVGLGLGLWSLWVAALQWPPLRTGYRRISRWIDLGFALVLACLALRLMIGW
jgi:threonine efflux protein